MTISFVENKLHKIAAENVRKYRKEKGLSQEELAARCGLHRTYIGSVERGERNVTLDTLQVIAVALERPPAEFLLTENSNA